MITHRVYKYILLFVHFLLIIYQYLKLQAVHGN